MRGASITHIWFDEMSPVPPGSIWKNDWPIDRDLTPAELKLLRTLQHRPINVDRRSEKSWRGLSVAGFVTMANISGASRVTLTQKGREALGLANAKKARIRSYEMDALF